MMRTIAGSGAGLRVPWVPAPIDGGRLGSGDGTARRRRPRTDGQGLRGRPVVPAGSWRGFRASRSRDRGRIVEADVPGDGPAARDADGRLHGCRWVDPGRARRGRSGAVRADRKRREAAGAAGCGAGYRPNAMSIGDQSICADPASIHISIIYSIDQIKFNRSEPQNYQRWASASRPRHSPASVR